VTGPAAANPSAGAGDTAGRLTIERLRLRAAGLDEGAAHRLATLVGEALAPSLQLPVGSTAIQTLHVEVAAHTGDCPETLSSRIVEAIGRALARDGAPVGGRVLGAEEVAP
jgi:hypothetical protein